MAICTVRDDELDRTLIEKTIAGYQSQHQLHQNEQQALPEAIIYTAQVWINWFGQNGYGRYAQRHQTRLNNFYQMKISFR